MSKPNRLRLYTGGVIVVLILIRYLGTLKLLNDILPYVSINLLPMLSTENENTIFVPNKLMYNNTTSKPIQTNSSTITSTTKSIKKYESKIYVHDIHGSCTRKPKRKFLELTIAGMYNTGTNALYHVLNQNCFGKKSNLKGFKQYNKNMTIINEIYSKIEYFEKTNWAFQIGSKHNMAPTMEYLNNNYKQRHRLIDNTLTIVIIKDPLTWLKSICKASYGIHFVDHKGFKTKYCPSNFTKQNNQLFHWNRILFEDLISFYNQWYSSWLGLNTIEIQAKRNPVLSSMKEKNIDINTYLKEYWKEYLKYNGTKTKNYVTLYKEFQYNNSFISGANNLSILIIRQEDLLFNPVKVNEYICNCVNGYNVPYNEYNNEVIRSNHGDTAKSHGSKSNLSSVINKYGNKKYRFEGYSKKDLNFIRTRMNFTILETFGYEF